MVDRLSFSVVVADICAGQASNEAWFCLLYYWMVFSGNICLVLHVRAASGSTVKGVL